MGEQARDLGVEFIGIGKVHQAYRASTDLVLIGRSDAALGGADLNARRIRRFAMRVELAMQGEDQRDILGDLEIVWADFDALAAQFLDFLNQMIGVEHDAIADDGYFAGRTMPEGSSASLNVLPSMTSV